ncbi:hypothetical protein BC835DRAFT_1306039 [Cytidiella melzeri]|nr:hypothetical protein BC835DRAFT_1306039 [Cytidiella melzeri]
MFWVEMATRIDRNVRQSGTSGTQGRKNRWCKGYSGIGTGKVGEGTGWARVKEAYQEREKGTGGGGGGLGSSGVIKHANHRKDKGATPVCKWCEHLFRFKVYVNLLCLPGLTCAIKARSSCIPDWQRDNEVDVWIRVGLPFIEPVVHHRDGDGDW